ncbi:hypothetical protein EW145_g3144 [Phellinidium pouzarii]|uniref:Polyketide synthase-like phosphopantetheine-binding domain-containing protein n=1 Tax=Phellinidium pouzarii TaxID=167371 RepID=A0A4S4LA53_9AGAM|nr:hypothetical protein EW145_g3144 [Phellinidium pouzarii]
MVPLVPPVLHGLQSSTFVQPPLDFSISFPALFDWQAEHSPKHPLFVFEDAPGYFRTILWAEAIQGIHRATQFVRNAVGNGAQSGSGVEPVLAILANSDTISFFSFLAGALRTGLTLFPVSPRNSAPAVAALLSQTRATHLFISAEPANHKLADAALKLTNSKIDIEKHAMPVFGDLFPVEGCDPSFTPVPLSDIDMNANAIIYHSSGTTAFPKPIYITQRNLLNNCAHVCYCDADLAGSIFACHAVQMFHGMGLFIIQYALITGFVSSVFKPQSPAVIPNTVNVIEGAIAAKADYILVTPTFVEAWSHDFNYVKALAKTKGVIYAGGPLGKDVGDYLVSQGVNIFILLGSTQAMGISYLLESQISKDWEYFRLSPIREAHFEDYGNNEYELIVLESGTYRPNVVNTTVNGRAAYATRRTDDQIMHSTGEKTNPGPLEDMLNRDAIVHGSMMFGRSRFHCGVLVQPKEPFAFDPADTKKVVEFRNYIWPTIENMNVFAPTHSRIFKEMIIVTSPFKPILYTPKGSLRRQATHDQYVTEIDAIYAAVDESAQDDIPGPMDWSMTSVREFVSQVVEKTMKKNEREISENSCFDSLQATWIRNTLIRVLRETHPAVARKLSATFIYDHPTITALSEYLSGNVTGSSVSSLGSIEDKRRELQILVSRYTESFPEFKVAPADLRNEAAGDAVLLTGSTGSLGSNILAKLIEREGVSRVYAMTRPSSDGVPAKEKHMLAFAREGLDVGLLNNSKVKFLVGEPSQADFAVEIDIFEEMQSSVTHIVHNAWRVNFNVAVTSFESNIRSVRNFVDFSLGGHGAQPARVLFISSIGVFQSYKENEPVEEETLAQPDSAIGTGYAESKWVSEQILEKASAETPLSTTVVRCGQMVGGPSGAWNDHEWFPSLVKSSVALQKIPDVKGTVSWITADDAADAIVDMMHADSERTLHLVHPRPVPWSLVIGAIAKGLGLSIVSYGDWLSSLEHAHRDLYDGSPDAAKIEKVFRENPALRLMSFFSSARDRVDVENLEPLGIVKMRCEKAVASSKTLKEAGSIVNDDARRWIASWRRTGFIQ